MQTSIIRTFKENFLFAQTCRVVITTIQTISVRPVTPKSIRYYTKVQFQISFIVFLLMQHNYIYCTAAASCTLGFLFSHYTSAFLLLLCLSGNLRNCVNINKIRLQSKSIREASSEVKHKMWHMCVCERVCYVGWLWDVDSKTARLLLK